ncbi:hypothetical protein EJ04DRAFT_514058 [Polyplosphaeria fusca]|uniref:Uncharacterized protein n=1 Tax=Polyplosphaeria fusca TaxID=682080 RepID=A0A9P4QWG6_9PLEO|nr:hypothetical protein EJ04DRAFT_514058 [Polyplosphaeria fusca]
MALALKVALIALIVAILPVWRRWCHRRRQRDVHELEAFENQYARGIYRRAHEPVSRKQPLKRLTSISMGS